MHDKLLALLGIAQKARFLTAGVFLTEQAVAKGKARLVIIATDASANTRDGIEKIAYHYEVPVIYYGHSMGSFIAREYIRRYGTDPRLKGAIICGTSGANPAAAAGIMLSNTIAKTKGSLHKSELINKIAFGTYLKQIPSARTIFDWLTYDNAIVDKYIADPYCGFLFSAVGYRDLFTLLKTVSAEDWYEQVPKTLPLLITAGEEDPVGAYGKGPKEVASKLRAQGCYDVTLKVYPGMRHEIHNEVDRETVYEDIGEWALSKLK